MMFPYALTIFLSAFLLFQVQPVIARFILPWYGGSPAVWTTCMCFFQVALLVGYLYSDVVARRMTPRVQAIIHLLVMSLTLLTLPIIPAENLKPTGQEDPALSILGLLLRTVAPTYCLLATTGPLIQAWFAQAFPGRSPYRLFALSNLGSLLALVSYPLIVEPTTSLRLQAWVWSVGYGMFVAASAWCGWLVLSRKANESSSITERRLTTEHGGAEPSGIGLAPWVLWVGLATIPSVLLLAVTNELSQDVAVVPMLWIVPLSLYLISFIICFDRPAWYRRELFGTLLICSALGSLACLLQPTQVGYLGQFLIYNLMLFSACMTCHGELARLKPGSSSLTLYYLALSVGGALGGILVVVVAPCLFQRFLELPLAMIAAIAVMLGCWIAGRDGVSLTRTMLGVSAITSTGLVLGFYYLREQLEAWVVLRLAMVASLVFIALSLLGWQHLTRRFLPPRLANETCAPRVSDRGLWLVTFGLLCGYGWSVLVWPAWLDTGGPLLTLGMALIIWGVGIHTHFRPVVSLTLYYNLGVVFAIFLVQIVVVGILFGKTVQRGRTLDLKRNFFGISGVGQFDTPLDGEFREIFNGRIGHGRQYLREEYRLQPNLYYGPGSGIGLAFSEHPQRLAGNPLRVGVIGLGTGTLVSWGKAGDEFVYYEINPAVIELADQFFSYRQEAPFPTETRLGDARVLLESDLKQGQPQRFDLLIVDAFSGDSIPRHLLTREAMAVYCQHLAPGGILAVHISNHYLDLRPVVTALAQEFNRIPLTVLDNPDRSESANRRLLPSDWMLVTDNQEFLNRPKISQYRASQAVQPRLWTDDFGSLLHVMKWKLPGYRE